ncbi:MAG TPA: alpha/beta hydrolase [Chthoniobacterales bacterium]|nr:alpha/beta hydrolase [Chthoniobacterales bacterium]
MQHAAGTNEHVACVRVRLVRWVILPATLLLFLASLLVLVSAPTERLWIAAIVMSEWGHYAALACVCIVAIAFGAGRIGLTIAFVAAITALICMLPTLRAFAISRALPNRCTAAFGTVSRSGRPFDPVVLFRGHDLAAVTVSEHEYAKPDRKSLRLDLYRLGAAAEPQPLVIMIHGGSWNGGSKRQLRAINRWLAGQRYTVASINYRHAPKWRSPAPVDDVFAAIDFLRVNAQQLHIDATRIVLIGRSAGGQIALSAAYSGRDAAIRGVVSFYAPTDLVLGYGKPSRRSVLDSKKALEDYLGGSPTEQPAAYAAASPLRHVNSSTPPTLLMHGELDPIVWPLHSELLSARLKEAGRPSLYLSLPWATHGCDANISGPSGQLSLYAIGRFLDAVLETAVP